MLNSSLEWASVKCTFSKLFKAHGMLNPMESCKSVFGRRASSRAFTIVELLTVMAVIAILSAILLPVLGGVLRSGEQAESLNRMRQIGQWMQLYAQDSNDVVLPSRFD